ncbi:hypothetical protein [Paracoccus limosus]|uniref:hypothetical protein n=1 Tax=Paracoccus limosus TaxID=913252 RepID=UPI001FE93A7C|nr:hypothetical protein [Paracoccus limosus]
MGGKGSKDADQRGGNSDAVRAARQAANRAEREARRAANQARRAERKGADAAAEPARPAAASRPFNILIVAQAGRIGREALLFAASLRHSSPGWRGRLIVAEPLAEAAWVGVKVALEPTLREALTELGAEVVPFAAQHFGRNYPHGNKIEALSLLPVGEPFIFFDSDTLVTGPLEGLAIDFDRPSASMRRSASWPEPPLYGPGYGGIWKSLYDRFGLDFDSSLDLTQPDEHWERYLYFNAGWFLGPDPAEFARLFLEWALAVRDDPGDALACQSLDPWLDQIVLPLVIHALGGGRPAPELSGLDGAVTCHYRTLSLLYAREPAAAGLLVQELLRDPDLAQHFADDPAVCKLVFEAEGARMVRELIPDPAAMTEQMMRKRLKQAGLWFR